MICLGNLTQENKQYEGRYLIKRLLAAAKKEMVQRGPPYSETLAGLCQRDIWYGNIYTCSEKVDYL